MPRLLGKPDLRWWFVIGAMISVFIPGAATPQTAGDFLQERPPIQVVETNVYDSGVAVGVVGRRTFAACFRNTTGERRQFNLQWTLLWLDRFTILDSKDIYGYWLDPEDQQCSEYTVPDRFGGTSSGLFGMGVLVLAIYPDMNLRSGEVTVKFRMEPR